jgi:hypothetical protein
VNARLTEDIWQQQVAALTARVQELERHNKELTQQLSQAVILNEDKQAELTAVGQAIGASLPEMRLILEVLLGKRASSVATLGRRSKAIGERSQALLTVLDEFSSERVRQALADEIYVSDPVMMVVEPESMCWTTGKLVKRKELTGAAWADQFQSLPHLQQVTSDAGRSLQCGLKEINERRCAAGLSELSGQLDHFHSLRDGGVVLAGMEKKLRGAMADASAAEARLTEARRRGQSLTVLSNKTRARWALANRLFDEWSRCLDIWKKVKQTLLLVTPEGELNTRQRAEAILAELLPQLPERFDKSRRLLQHPNTLTHLDQVHEKLQQSAAPAEVLQAAVRQETLRRAEKPAEASLAAQRQSLLLVCAVILQKAGDVGQKAVEEVRRIFRQSWRASSLVECLNSVVRMHQARHRKLTQSLLDLKRLYWNTHKFRTGRRRGKHPYELLGLPWPDDLRWWDLLKMTPEQLRAKLSALTMAA